MRWRFQVAAVAAVAAGIALAPFWQGWILFWRCIVYYSRQEPYVCVAYPERPFGVVALIASAILAGVAIQLVYRRPRVPLRIFRLAAVPLGLVLVILGGVLTAGSLVLGESLIAEHNESCIGPVSDPLLFEHCRDLTAGQRGLRGWSAIGSILTGLGGALSILGLVSAFVPSFPLLGFPVWASGALLSLQTWEEMVGFAYCSPRIVYGGTETCPGAFSAIGAIPFSPILLGLVAGVCLGAGIVLVVLREAPARPPMGAPAD